MVPSGDEQLDPRQVRTRARVFAAARAVLRREGLSGATIDAIANEAGVARSTVYRNWATREELIAAAVDDVIGPPMPGDAAGSLREQLLRALRELGSALESSEWGRTLPAVVAAIDAEPELAGRYGRLTEERRSAMAAVLAAGVRRRELPAGTPVDELIDALVGPLFYRRLVRRAPISRPWLVRHLDRTLAAFGARPAR